MHVQQHNSGAFVWHNNMYSCLAATLPSMLSLQPQLLGTRCAVRSGRSVPTCAATCSSEIHTTPVVQLDIVLCAV